MEYERNRRHGGNRFRMVAVNGLTETGCYQHCDLRSCQGARPPRFKCLTDTGLQRASLTIRARMRLSADIMLLAPGSPHSSARSLQIPSTRSSKSIRCRLSSSFLALVCSVTRRTRRYRMRSSGAAEIALAGPGQMPKTPPEGMSACPPTGRQVGTASSSFVISWLSLHFLPFVGPKMHPRY